MLLEKLERKHRVIDYFSKVLPEDRLSSRIVHSNEKLLKQRVFMLVQGYEDANDVQHLQHDPLIKDVLQGVMASQPTISRFENSMDKHAIFKLCNAWVDRYVATLKGRDKIVIDVDGTDDPTHGAQQ